jgi:hypothetical protein
MRDFKLLSPMKGILPISGLSANSLQDQPPDSEYEESENDSTAQKCTSYTRTPIQWKNVIYFVKGDEATMDEDETKSQIQGAANRIMKDS